MPTAQPSTNEGDRQPRLPSRGVVLCILEDQRVCGALEAALTRRGYSLLRARHGMHGYWLAHTARPDVILTDVPDPDHASDYLLDCLARNPRTQTVPIIALVDSVTQQQPGISCLRLVESVLLKTADTADVVQLIDRLIAAHPVSKTVDDLNSQRFDAFYAQFGHDGVATPKLRSWIDRERFGHGATPKIDQTVG